MDLTERNGKVLVLGIGNDILTDDGIGIRLVDDLLEKNLPHDIVVGKGTVGGLEILEMIEGYREVLFLDAIKTTGGRPGEVYHMVLSDFLETLHLSNLHDVSFIEAIRLGRELGFHLPEKIHIFAVEIIEDRVFSRHLTKELEIKYPAILVQAHQFILDELIRPVHERCSA